MALPHFKMCLFGTDHIPQVSFSPTGHNLSLINMARCISLPDESVEKCWKEMLLNSLLNCYMVKIMKSLSDIMSKEIIVMMANILSSGVFVFSSQCTFFTLIRWTLNCIRAANHSSSRVPVATLCLSLSFRSHVADSVGVPELPPLGFGSHANCNCLKS